MRFVDIPRNSVSDAIAFVTESLDRDGFVTGDAVRSLYLLQDEGDVFTRALADLVATRKRDGKSAEIRGSRDD